MKKKYLVAMIILLAFAALLLFLFKNKDSEPDEQQKVNGEPIPPVVEEEDEFDAIGYINEILVHAEKGMLPKFSFVAGKSTIAEVDQQLGTPDSIDVHEGLGEFAAYEKHKVTIGFKEGTAFDVRSYDEDLQKIRYENLLDYLGAADEIKYYKDDEYDQIILIYHLTEQYHLKWILQRPTEQEPNPFVHHLSLVALKTDKDEKEKEKKPAPTIEEQAASMTIDEKIGQMIFAGISGTKPNAEAEQLIVKYKVGGIIFNGKNLTHPSQTVAYLNYLKTINQKNSIPLFFGIDQEGGRIAKLPGDLRKTPTNEKIGELNNLSFSYEMGALLGQLVEAYGFNMNFAPVLDVNSNPDNPVIGDRSFGDDPELVSRLGIEMMKGLQQEKIIPVIKHFPGHGDTTVDSHLALPTVNKSKAELETMELYPFKKAMEAGVDAVMIGHILFPKLDPVYPSSMSRAIIDGLLRKEMGFDGVVMTDDMTMKAITGNYDIGRAAVESVLAGSDVIMVAHEFENIKSVIQALKSAVHNGEISEERLIESVIRILKLKEKYALNDTIRGEVSVKDLNRKIDALLDKYLQ